MLGAPEGAWLTKAERAVYFIDVRLGSIRLQGITKSFELKR